MQRFTNLLVWQRSHALALALYRLMAQFPGDEKFGLTSQLRRAALSVPTNIAEGSKRISRQDYARFLNMAEGSLAETEYLLMVDRDLGYLSAQDLDPHQKEVSEIASMLCSLRAKVSRMK
ncbi:MAG: four helix bundle protein [Candidatus Acidiferrales bacterium]